MRKNNTKRRVKVAKPRQATTMSAPMVAAAPKPMKLTYTNAPPTQTGAPTQMRTEPRMPRNSSLMWWITFPFAMMRAFLGRTRFRARGR